MLLSVILFCSFSHHYSTVLDSSLLLTLQFLLFEEKFGVQRHILWQIALSVMLFTHSLDSYARRLSWIYTIVRVQVSMIVCFVAGRQWLCFWLWGKKIKTRRAIFLSLCKQLAASHACTINGHLIGNNHFYLSKFKIGSYPWNKQLLVKPSGDVALMLEDVVDQCLQEVVRTWALAYTTVGTHLWKRGSPNQSTVLDLLYAPHRCAG